MMLRARTPGGSGRSLWFWTVISGASYAGLYLAAHILLLPLPPPLIMVLGVWPVVGVGMAADLARIRNVERAEQARLALAFALTRFAWPPPGASRGSRTRQALADAAAAADGLAVVAERARRSDWALVASILRSDAPVPRVICALRTLGEKPAADCLEAAVELGRLRGDAAPS